MRYKYRVRLFYSIVFLIIGIILGYKLANYDFGSLKSVSIEVVENEDIKSNMTNIGVILPKSMPNAINAANLAAMEINTVSKKKINLVYESIDCIEEDAKTAINK